MSNFLIQASGQLSAAPAVSEDFLPKQKTREATVTYTLASPVTLKASPALGEASKTGNRFLSSAAKSPPSTPAQANACSRVASISIYTTEVMVELIIFLISGAATISKLNIASTICNCVAGGR